MQITGTNPAINGIDYVALTDRQFYVFSPILMVGIDSQSARKARARGRKWITGGWASQWLPIIPSSTTDFAPAVQAQVIRCNLFQLNLIRFPDLGLSSYILNLAFPWWLEDASIEVWQYGENQDGSYTSVDINSSIARIERQIEFIANRDVPTQYDVDINDSP